MSDYCVNTLHSIPETKTQIKHAVSQSSSKPALDHSSIFSYCGNLRSLVLLGLLGDRQMLLLLDFCRNLTKLGGVNCFIHLLLKEKHSAAVYNYLLYLQNMKHYLHLFGLFCCYKILLLKRSENICNYNYICTVK